MKRVFWDWILILNKMCIRDSNYGGYYRSYGYYSYGYGSYGKYSDKEFRSKPRKITKSISLTTTDEQKKALENERKNKGENKNEDE